MHGIVNSLKSCLRVVARDKLPLQVVYTIRR